MHKIYQFGNVNGDIFGEFIIISDREKADVIATHCPPDMELQTEWEIVGEASTLPCDRPLISL